MSLLAMGCVVDVCCFGVVWYCFVILGMYDFWFCVALWVGFCFNCAFGGDSFVVVCCGLVSGLLVLWFMG